MLNSKSFAHTQFCCCFFFVMFFSPSAAAWLFRIIFFFFCCQTNFFSHFFFLYYVSLLSNTHIASAEKLDFSTHFDWTRLDFIFMTFPTTCDCLALFTAKLQLPFSLFLACLIQFSSTEHRIIHLFSSFSITLNRTWDTRLDLFAL